MFQNIKPNRKRSKAGSLTKEEKTFVRALIKNGYVVQDIAFMINQGREKTVNQSVVQSCVENKNGIVANDEDLKHFLLVQSSYDPKTLLNPYKDARLIRAREAMISAVQAFNSPAISFKAEMFCVLANIAWTYLFHEKLEQTKKGSSVLGNGNSVTVSGTLDKDICPNMDPAVKENLKQIIKIRDDVEHTFFVGGEECFGDVFQSCCVNFDYYMTEWFGDSLSLSKSLSLALQFVRLKKDQLKSIESTNFPEKIKARCVEIQESEFAENNAFQMNVFYSTLVSSKTNADLYKLVDYSGDEACREVVIKKQQYTFLTQNELIKKINSKGYANFNKTDHLLFWKQHWKTVAIRNEMASKFGVLITKYQWLWYQETWLPLVLKYCEKNKEKFQ